MMGMGGHSVRAPAELARSAPATRAYARTVIGVNCAGTGVFAAVLLR